MLRVNLRDGRTLSFNLLDEAGMGDWLSRQAEESFQSHVTGLAVLWEGELHTLPLPRLYRRICWTASLIRHHTTDEALGVELSVLADDTRAALTVYFNGPVATRTDLQKVGKPRYIPGAR